MELQENECQTSPPVIKHHMQTLDMFHLSVQNYAKVAEVVQIVDKEVGI